jgi:hypothetical protein
MSTTNPAHRTRRVGGRHLGKIGVSLAVAATAVAITAPGASASLPGDGGSSQTACVFHTFKPSSTYQQCVKDEQVLLNDLFVHKPRLPGPDRQLATDGIYGPNTSRDVKAFNLAWGLPWYGDITARSLYPDSPGTWDAVCYAVNHYGLSGGSTYYRAAGCPQIIR